MVKRLDEVSELYKYAGMSNGQPQELDAMAFAHSEDTFKNTYYTIRERKRDDCIEFVSEFYILDRYKFWNYIKNKLKLIQIFAREGNDFAMKREIEEINKVVDEIDDKGDIHV